MTVNLTLGLIIGVELLAVAALLFLFGGSIARRWPQHAWLVSFGRIALAIVGVGLAAGTLVDTTPDSGTHNPVPFTVTSVEAGRSLYVANCAACHGEDAKGNPEVGAPNLTDPFWIYGGDAQTIEATVWGGRQGHMPTWESRLSALDRKILALYIVDLRKPNP